MLPKVSRRTFLRMAGTVTGAAVLAACSPAAAPAQPAAAPAAAQPTTAPAAAQPTTVPAAAAQATVEWWDTQTGTDQSTQATMITQFMGANPGIKINRTYIAQDQNTQANDKLLTAIAGGTPPDMFHFDRFIVAQFAAQGFLTDLTALATSAGVKASDYWPFAWEEANYQGKLYALPYDTDTRALWYNKDIFTQAGLDPAKPPQTLKELQDMADKLTTKASSGKVTRWGYLPTADQAWTYTYGFAFKGLFQDATTLKITCSDPQIGRAHV